MYWRNFRIIGCSHPQNKSIAITSKLGRFQMITPATNTRNNINERLMYSATEIPYEEASHIFCVCCYVTYLQQELWIHIYPIGNCIICYLTMGSAAHTCVFRICTNAIDFKWHSQKPQQKGSEFNVAFQLRSVWRAWCRSISLDWELQCRSPASEIFPT